jgi:hypothetical protein
LAESKRHPLHVKGSDAEAGNENALPLSGLVAISALIMCCISLTTIRRVPFVRPPGIFRNKIIGQLSYKVKVWGGTLDMLREFRNSVG